MKTLKAISFLLLSFNVYALPFLAPKEDLIDCNYYLEREMTQHCGPKGYLVNFGYKYCHNFLYKKRNRFDFSQKAYLWMTQVGHCLQKSLHEKDLEREYNSRPYMSCNEIAKYSYSMHSSCYLRPDKTRPEISACNLSAADYLKLTNVIKATFTKVEVWKQIRDVIKECREVWL